MYRKRDPGRVPAVPAAAALDRILSRADYPADRLVEKLTERGYSADDAQRAVASAVAAGWVDDRRLMERLIPALIRQGKGPRAIRAALLARGFDKNDVDAVDYEEIASSGEYGGREADMTSACRALMEKKDLVENGRLTEKGYAFLLRRGYTPAIIREALDKLREEGG